MDQGDMHEETNKRLLAVCQAMELPVQFQADPGDSGRALPLFNPTAMISKLAALLVHAGAHVPVGIMPSYNSVHADVQAWKEHFAKEAAGGVHKPEQP